MLIGGFHNRSSRIEFCRRERKSMNSHVSQRLRTTTATTTTITTATTITKTIAFQPTNRKPLLTSHKPRDTRPTNHEPQITTTTTTTTTANGNDQDRAVGNVACLSVGQQSKLRSDNVRSPQQHRIQPRSREHTICSSGSDGSASSPAASGTRSGILDTAPKRTRSHLILSQPHNPTHHFH